MVRKRRAGRPPAAPPDGDPPGSLPSDGVTKSVTVKLNGPERKVLGKCRRLLADAEGDDYPSVSHVLRLALGALFHSLTGQVPELGPESPPAGARDQAPAG